jgi:hypothetical protein
MSLDSTAIVPLTDETRVEEPDQEPEKPEQASDVTQAQVQEPAVKSEEPEKPKQASNATQAQVQEPAVKSEEPEKPKQASTNASTNASEASTNASTNASSTNASEVTQEPASEVTQAQVENQVEEQPNEPNEPTVGSGLMDAIPELITSTASNVASNVASTFQDAAAAIKTNAVNAAVGVAAAVGLTEAEGKAEGEAQAEGEAEGKAEGEEGQAAATGSVILAEFPPNNREMIENGLQQFNQVLASEPMESHITKLETQIKTHHSGTAFIKLTPTSPTDETFSGPVIVSYCNLSLGGLSDFVPHHNLFIFTNFPSNDPLVALIETIRSYFLTDLSLRGTGFELTPSLISGPRISLRLHIGSVFSVPVCTVHVMNLVLVTDRLPSMLAPIEPEPFIYNAKPVGPYNRLDLMMELWMQSDAAAANEDPYAEVNAVVARGINELCVKRFATEQPNAVIQQLHGAFMEVTDPKNTHLVGTRLIKNALIAILQNPAVQTTEQMKFSDIFPSGQYGAYFDELAHRCDTVRAVGPLMVRIGEGEDSFPLSRTDIIVAALTAVNAAMQSADTGEGEGEGTGMGHIVVGGGAAVSHYIQDFLQNSETFNADAAVVQNMDQLTERCRKIRMNDIDCFVFGDVPRQFLLLFSIYMMILYDNFYERPKRYNKTIPESQVANMRFNLSSGSDDHIDLFMYGNRKNDANTQLISKRLQKNPKVQIVTQETKCFSQLVHPVCSLVAKGEGEGETHAQTTCKDDSYYMQPIDLVKKDIQEFIDLYRISLYTPDQIPPPDDLSAMVRRQYTSDNMVSMKTVMLDLICIFCDEGQSLFIRIFMARKNPKDFSRLRVFIDVYLLHLVRTNAPAFVAVKDDFIAAVERLRDKMDALNTKYYLEQGNIAAINAETAAQVTQDRADFLTLLRDIGRRVVTLPDPLDDRVPVKFQSVIGANTVAFFKKNRTMKYRFNMNLHMKELVSLYQGTDVLSQAHATQCRAWLDRVFSRIKFSTDAEAFFESKLEQAISPVNPDGNRKIGFKDMPLRSSFMLRLHDALKSVKAHEGVFRKFGQMFTVMLRPIREHVARYGMLPTAQYVGLVDGVYGTNEKRRLFPTLVRDVFLSDEVERNPENMDASIMLTELNKRNNVYDKYDDAVKEEIGRILLEYARDYMGKLRGGGKTRRKKQMQLHKKTRTSRKKVSAATRKRRTNFRMKHRHTRARMNA